MPQKKKHVFLKDILNPHTTTQQRKQVVAESRILTDVTVILPSYESNRKQPPSLMGLLLLSCLADGGAHALLRRVQATFIWLFSCFFSFYASHTGTDYKYTKVIFFFHFCRLVSINRTSKQITSNSFLNKSKPIIARSSSDYLTVNQLG